MQDVAVWNGGAIRPRVPDTGIQSGLEFQTQASNQALSSRHRQGVSSTKNPNRKTCKKNRTILSVPDRDGRFTWSPGAEKLPTAPGGPGGRTVQDGRNAEITFTATSGLRVCVLYCHYICTCVLLCVVCANKN